MLVLSRKKNQRVQIGDEIVLTINQIKGNRVLIGIEAPKEVSIRRGELQMLDVAAGKTAQRPPQASKVA